MSVTSDLSFHLKKSENKEQFKHKVNRREEIMKIRVENNAMKDRKARETINEAKS